jgi:hypothetical protein
VAAEGVGVTEWWRVVYDRTIGGSLLRDPDGHVVENEWRETTDTIGALWESVPRGLYYVSSSLPLRRWEIPIWTDETLNEYLRR